MSNHTFVQDCQPLIKRCCDLLKTIPLRSKRFGIEPEITAKLARRRAILYEVPISYHGRDYQQGKKIGWNDGVSAIWTIIKFAFMDDSDTRQSKSLSCTKAVEDRRVNQMTFIFETNGAPDYTERQKPLVHEMDSAKTSRFAAICTDPHQRKPEKLKRRIVTS